MAALAVATAVAVAGLAAPAIRATAADLPKFRTVSAGSDFAVAISTGGDLYAWGNNAVGQLGLSRIGEPEKAAVKGQITSLTAIAAGGRHALAVNNVGDVYSWGDNGSWQLGYSAGSTGTPTKVPDPHDMVQVAAGTNHSLAVNTTQQLYTWGGNTSGQLGDGTTANSSIPLPVDLSGEQVKQVAAGNATSYALLQNGTLWAWGRGDLGQLGVGWPTAYEATPVQITGLGANVKAVAAGATHALAITTENELYAWGNNANGQLGDGTTDSANSPIKVAELGNNVTAITAGNGFSAALAGGALYTWGANAFGQLGTGTLQEQSRPTRVSLSGVSQISAGSSFLLALTSSGNAYAWGANTSQQLGNGASGNTAEPHILTAPKAVSVAVGYDFTVAASPDGRVQAWGKNDQRQLGNTTTTDASRPVPVAGASSVTQVAAGAFHTLARRGDGRVLAWGLNDDGQLGDGTVTARASATQVGDLTGVSQVAAGLFHSVALAGGTCYVWGDNSYGQVGSSVASTDYHRPQALSVSVSFATIAAGGNYSLALTTDGKIYSWGENGRWLGRQASAIEPADQPFPIAVPGTPRIVAIAAGLRGAIAVDESKRVWVWGMTPDGANPTTPAEVTTVSQERNASQVAAGNGTFFVVTSGGQVWAWGENGEGQLGLGNTDPAPNPMRVGTSANTVAAGSGSHTAALRGNDLAIWGSNAAGQLGYTPDAWTPKVLTGTADPSGGRPSTPPPDTIGASGGPGDQPPATGAPDPGPGTPGPGGPGGVTTPQAPLVKSIGSSIKTIRVVRGKTVKVPFVAYPIDTSATGNVPLTASSSKRSIATVTATVNAKLKGKATVAIKGRKVGTSTVVVRASSGAKLTLKIAVVSKATKTSSARITTKLAKNTLARGKSKTFAVTVRPRAATGTVVAWKSSAPSVASVDAAGKVIAKKKGKTTISAKIGSSRARYAITVK
jgi:alpha-tubulin suppressor-like RCC1 family protein